MLQHKMLFKTFTDDIMNPCRAEMKKSTVAKCLGIHGRNPYSNWLKTSTGLITAVHMYVCLNHSTYMFQPETSKRQKKPCRGLEISMPKSQTQGSSTNHTASSLLTTWGAVLGNPGTILVKAMPEGKRDLGSELLWSPPQKDCFKMSWVKNWGAVVHKGFYFRTRCLQASVNLTCMPTCGKSSTNIYIYIHANLAFINSVAVILHLPLISVLAVFSPRLLVADRSVRQEWRYCNNNMLPLPVNTRQYLIKGWKNKTSGANVVQLQSYNLLHNVCCFFKFLFYLNIS